MVTPSNNPDKITYFAETDYRSKRIKFGIRDEDRARHMYVIGKTGMGKSTLLENLAIQDIQNGEGVCFIDPHGGTAETLLSYVPEHRINDVIYFAPYDQEFPVGLNVMEDMGRDKRPLVVSGLMGSFKKVWADMWSARMEYILNNTMLALMETPGTTLLGVNRMYSDKDYRNMIVANITDPSVRAFWVDEYAKYSEKFATEATAAIQNKVGQFAANPLIRNLVGQPKSTFDIRDIMDKRKIFIVNLSKGRMGEGNANLVGSMLITKIYLAAMSRADVGPESVKNLPPFYLYVDEFQSFANESFADILSEARKYKLSLTIAHQYIEQMSDEVRAAVFGNVGTMISFRVGSYDADVLEKEFAPVFLAEDMVNLGFAQVYMKLMIRGIGSAPFSATTLNRPAMPARNFAQEVIDASHRQFALPRAQVEEDIRKWHEPTPPPPRDPNASSVPETKKYAPGARPERTQTFTPSVPPRTFIPTPIAPIMTPVQAPQAPDTSIVQQAQEVVTVPAVPLIVSRPSMLVPKAPYHVSTLSPSSVVMVNENTATPKTLVSTEKRPPAYHVFGTVDTTAKILPPQSSAITPQLHQPFKQEFQKLNTDRDTKDSVNEKPQQESEAVQTRPSVASAPLSLLKSQPKKDKGPSAENMSGLKAALHAAMTSNKGQVPSSGESKISPNPRVPHVSPDSIEQGKSYIPKVIEEKSTKPIPEIKPRVLLDDMISPVTPQEIPEDILRGVLAD